MCLLRGTFYILRPAPTLYLCVLCGPENKQRLFHSTTITDWFFITKRECVYCAVRTEYLNKTTDVSSLKGESTPFFRGRVFKPQSRNQDVMGWSCRYGRKVRGTCSTDMGQSAVKV